MPSKISLAGVDSRGRQTPADDADAETPQNQTRTDNGGAVKPKRNGGGNGDGDGWCVPDCPAVLLVNACDSREHVGRGG